MFSNNPLILITGATCSGKSSLAIKVAKEFNAEVVSIDSVQVYKDFDIGSAKVTSKETKGVKHHLLSIWEPNEKFNVAKYLKIADEVISNIYKQGKNVVIAGGTTMYVTSLIHGLAKISGQNEDLRDKLESKDIKTLYKILSRVDNESAKILNPNDKTRIIRAIEVKLTSKKSIQSIKQEHKFLSLKYNVLSYVICQTREELYSKINLRTKQMIDDGLIDETKTLLKKYDNNAAPFLSIGYKQAVEFLQNKISKDEMIEEISKCTRHLAKRQMTYLRNEPMKRGWDVYPKDDDKNAMLLSSDNSTIVGKGVIKDFLVYNYNINELINDININLTQGVSGVKLTYIHVKSDI